MEKIDNQTTTLADQDEALKKPWSAYKFARLNIPGTDIERCQKAACKDLDCAYYFALVVAGADINYCQKYACKESEYAYFFARDIPEANIKYCRKACESDPEWLRRFDKMIAKKVLA